MGIACGTSNSGRLSMSPKISQAKTLARFSGYEKYVLHFTIGLVVFAYLYASLHSRQADIGIASDDARPVHGPSD